MGHHFRDFHPARMMWLDSARGVSNLRDRRRCRRRGAVECPVLELDALLLDAKLSAPRPRPGTVSHAGLIESARSSGYQVVGVTAPAGYGKSTLLAEWAHVEDRPVAWVSLDEFDDDPAILLTLLASAYARVSPGDDGPGG